MAVGEKSEKKDKVEEKQKEEPKDSKEVTEEKEEKKDPNTLTIEDIKNHLKNIEKAVSLKEARYVTRVLRAIPATRRRLNPLVLRQVIFANFPAVSASKDILLQYVDEPMDVDTPADSAAGTPPKSILPEVDCYLHLLVLIHLLDEKQYERTLACANCLVEKVAPHNRRSLDPIAARCFFYYSRSYELCGRLEEIRSVLFARLRTSTLRHDIEGQATILNLLLRNLLHFKLYEQASKLVSRSTFPESAPNSEAARYMYYLGVIKAVQLDYSEAHKFLTQALRKAPQSTAIGFRQTVNKYACVVQLLLGQIPDRAIFRQPELCLPLAPYFQLTQAVRSGDLQRFTDTVTQFHDRFSADQTYMLITRLRHNVIKAGVRMISVSYSRISMQDVAARLQLESAEDAEFVVAKCIRDGVIEATIDHTQGYMQSKETSDVYGTTEPQAAFHQRIRFCLEVHNQSVKAMRYPPKSTGKEDKPEPDHKETDIAALLDEIDAELG